MATVVEEKSMVPTVLVGVGGTGAEVLSRVRRLIEETYGSLKNFPIISFLWIDTDKGYKISNPEAAGSPLLDIEKHWARVTGREVRDIVSHMENYPWIDRWFPKELERNITSLEAGAGQIRACGRFALFCNYREIQKKFLEASQRIKSKENYMLDRYEVKVSTNSLNVFVTGSLSGGTGSGMLIDLGYCIREWLRGESSPLVTAIVPTPNAFAGISVGERLLANGYAAMMELSYFSDYRTEYVARFSDSTADEVRNNLPPFDFTYLVGTKNGETEFNLPQIREAIAQNIFLDLTSDFAPHKRSIRDNIKGAWAQSDPGGRGYPKNFMSFGLSTIEIPISQIRASLAYRLSSDLIAWWLNESVELPPQMIELLRGDILKRMRLTDAEMLADLSAASDRPYLSLVAEWVNGLRNEIGQGNWLQCTQQGVNVMGSEQGNILKFIDEFLQPKVDAYRQEHFRELSTDERLHGDFLKKMYDNRDKLIRQGCLALTEEFYQIVSDRTRGPKFADNFIATVRQIFEDSAEKFRQERDKIWVPNETNRRNQYEEAIRSINEFKDRFGLTKQDKMGEYCEDALDGLEGTLIALVQRKTRALGLEAIARLQEHLSELEGRFVRFEQKLSQWRDECERQAQKEADSADALTINGIKLFERQEINQLYQDLLEQWAGASEGRKSRREIGLDRKCATLSSEILQDASPLWRESRAADEVMRLLDVTEIPEVRDDDFQDIIADRTKQAIVRAPQNSQLQKELAACDRLFQALDDADAIRGNLRIAYQKSAPLVVLDRGTLLRQDYGGGKPATNINVAILGGSKTSDPAAQKLLPYLKEMEGIGEDAVKPMGEPERHRIVFVREIGGFSLRCIDGMKDLRRSYQDWRGQTILAKRAQLRGEKRDLPIPVHIEKQPPFWDIFPEDPAIFESVVLARALGVLRQEENRVTKERVVRYARATAIGRENIDIAASWEEAPQMLEVAACRTDREEIQRQINAELDKAETETQKQQLFDRLAQYLADRARELERQGGQDSPDYKREATVVLELVKARGLKTGGNELEDATEPLGTATPDSQPDPEPQPAAPDSQEEDGLERLQQLAEMYKSGMLTAEEFQAAKRRLLGL